MIEQLQPANPARVWRACFALLIAASVLVVYNNTFGVPFLFDDFATIPGNASIRDLSRFGTVLFPPPEVYSAGRPVLNLSFAINYAISGVGVRGYHVGNLIIHLLSALTLFSLIERTLRLPRFAARFDRHAPLIALAIAILWAVHPLLTASVTYISQRAESLMGLFYLLTLYAFVRAAASGSRAWFAMSAAAAAIGMATKEVMVTAPILIFLCDWQYVAGSIRAAWQQRWKYYLALSASWLVLAALMIGSRLGKRAVGMDQGVTSINYLRIESQALLHYLRSAFWPDRLVFDFGADLPVPSATALVIPILVLGVIAVAGVVALRRKHGFGFLACSFFILLAPTSSFVPVAGQPIAENRMYLPLAAAMTAAVIGAFLLLGRRSFSGSAAAAVGLAMLALARNEHYQSALSVWRDTVLKQPANSRAWVFLTEEMKKLGKHDEAIVALTTALRYRPNSAELNNNLGVALFGAGKAAESFERFQNAIRLKPDYNEAYYNFGAALYMTGNFAPALQSFEASLRLVPTSVEAQNYAGLCALKLGNAPLAVQHFQRALEINPQHQMARANLQQALTLKASR